MFCFFNKQKSFHGQRRALQLVYIIEQDIIYIIYVKYCLYNRLAEVPGVARSILITIQKKYNFEIFFVLFTWHRGSDGRSICPTRMHGGEMNFWIFLEKKLIVGIVQINWEVYWIDILMSTTKNRFLKNFNNDDKKWVKNLQ